MASFILTRFILVKYSHAFVERPSQGTTSLASQLTNVSLDFNHYKLLLYLFLHTIQCIINNVVINRILYGFIFMQQYFSKNPS